MTDQAGASGEGSILLEKPKSAKAGSESGTPEWRLVAYNKRVVKDWLALCNAIPENCVKCYDWLSTDPKRRINARCYPLKHAKYRGVWCYEVGSSERIYYRPREDRRDVLVYYAGRHPKSGVPEPPAVVDDESS